MALTDRLPFRIARRFWHGWTQALPVHLVLAAGFTFVFHPIAATRLVDAQGVVPPHVAVAIASGAFLIFLSWAVCGHSMRTGTTLAQTLLSLFPLTGRALVACVLFLLAMGAPLTRATAGQGGIGLAVAAGLLAFGFFAYLEWSMLERQKPQRPPAAHTPFWKAVPLALWGDVVAVWRFLRGVWARTPLALGTIAAGLFVLSLLLLPFTALASFLWPAPPLWAGIFFSFFLFSSVPSLAAAALAVARAPQAPVA